MAYRDAPILTVLVDIVIALVQTRQIKVDCFPQALRDVLCRVKLRHFSLAAPMALATSDGAAERTWIAQTCLDPIEASVKRSVYVGDGHWDAKANAAFEWSLIAVGPTPQDAGHRSAKYFTSTAFWQHLEDIRSRVYAGVRP